MGCGSTRHNRNIIVPKRTGDSHNLSNNRILQFIIEEIEEIKGESNSQVFLLNVGI